MTTRTAWAVAIASLLGGAAGSFVAGSMDSAGLTPEGSQPLLGGSAAIYAALAVGLLVSGALSALVAYALGRSGRPSVGAVAGVATGVAAGVAVGDASESLASAWLTAFSANAPYAAFIGGVIGGAFCGVAVAGLLRVSRPPTPDARTEERFAAIVGAALGMFAGAGGGTVGFYLANVGSCTGGGTAPGVSVPSSCSFVPGEVLLGAVGGAFAGAMTALLGAMVLRFLVQHGAAAASHP